LQKLEESLKEKEKVASQQDSTADARRTEGYNLAQQVNGNLDKMNDQLEGVIGDLRKSLNSSSSSSPLMQIAEILNTHFEALQWVDQQQTSLQNRASEVMRMLQLQKINQDRFGRKFN
jgi:hypothetical protein